MDRNRILFIVFESVRLLAAALAGYFGGSIS